MCSYKNDSESKYQKTSQSVNRWYSFLQTSIANQTTKKREKVPVIKTLQNCHHLLLLLQAIGWVYSLCVKLLLPNHLLFYYNKCEIGRKLIAVFTCTFSCLDQHLFMFQTNRLDPSITISSKKKETYTRRVLIFFH